MLKNSLQRLLKLAQSNIVSLNQKIDHATPRTITHGDVALYTALYGTRFALHSSNEFAKNLALRESPIDDFLLFNIAFGKTVPDISLNALANLGYAGVNFKKPVFVGDTVKLLVVSLNKLNSVFSSLVYSPHVTDVVPLNSKSGHEFPLA